MSKFNAPASGDFIDFKDVNGALLLFVVYEETPEHMTVHGLNTAVVCDIVVLDGPQVGVTYDKSPIYPKALKPQLRPSIGGEMVLGRMGQSAAKPGQNPAWILAPATPADEALAEAYIESQGKPGEKAAAQAAQANKPF